jgi:hypothetical protein
LPPTVEFSRLCKQTSEINKNGTKAAKYHAINANMTNRKIATNEPNSSIALVLSYGEGINHDSLLTFTVLPPVALQKNQHRNKSKNIKTHQAYGM